MNHVRREDLPTTSDPSYTARASMMHLRLLIEQVDALREIARVCAVIAQQLEDANKMAEKITYPGS